jgi:hypothetical protein
MRSPREVYQKLREVKFRYLIKLYKKYLRKIPENCRYNYVYKFEGENEKTVEIQLCLLHQPEVDMKAGVFPNLIDVCQEPKHCVNCNAFIFRHTKNSIKQIFELELTNQKVKQEKYPDICALEWVLGSTEIPPLSWIRKFLLKFKEDFRSFLGAL